MRFIRKLILYFKADPARIQELEAVECQGDYPEQEDLRYLRAWLFRHSG